MPTVGEAIAKISELQSRWAILHELVTHLETHYRGSDAGPPELRIRREDHAAVPEIHIDMQIAYLAQDMDQIQKELDEWEKLAIASPSEPKIPKKAGAKKKRRQRGTTRQRANQSPAENNGQEGGGQAA